jgi:hypothetical protein
VSAGSQNVHAERTASLRGRAELFDPRERFAHWRRAHEHRHEHVLEAFDLLGPLAGIPCVTRRTREILDRGGRLTPPEPEIPSDTERTRQPRLVT